MHAFTVQIITQRKHPLRGRSRLVRWPERPNTDTYPGGPAHQRLRIDQRLVADRDMVQDYES